MKETPTPAHLRLARQQQRTGVEDSLPRPLVRLRLQSCK